MDLLALSFFFLSGTSYDKIRLVYLDEMGGMTIPIPKIFTTFSILSMASLTLPDTSGFVVELVVFFRIITKKKKKISPIDFSLFFFIKFK